LLANRDPSLGEFRLEGVELLQADIPQREDRIVRAEPRPVAEAAGDLCQPRTSVRGKRVFKPARTLYLAMTGLLALVRTPQLPNQPPALFFAGCAIAGPNLVPSFYGAAQAVPFVQRLGCRKT
jgi:hypothetical protein